MAASKSLRSVRRQHEAKERIRTMTTPTNERELVLNRLIDAPRHAVWRCWTEPELLRQWFAPKPWTTPRVEVDLRPGGAYNTTMADPDGKEFPGDGTYLEVVPDTRLVFTDAMTAGFVPIDGQPFMVASIELSDEGGKTRYIATARHWSTEAREQHEKMGFHEGWGQCADQLEALAKTL
jgi:uncharacterized protein YndB with AHSA1/START domain